MFEKKHNSTELDWAAIYRRRDELFMDELGRILNKLITSNKQKKGTFK